MEDGARRVRAFAKINLSLRVLGRRPDGYHEVDTVLQTVDLCDHLTFHRRDGAELRVTCDDPGIPAGSSNLVWKALDALRAEAGRPRLGMAVRIHKGIPPGSGLGGGSSDAACSLAVANGLWEAGLKPSDTERLASALGSDVPFFLRGGTQRGRGRGEQLEPLDALSGVSFGVLIPPLRVQTRSVYSRFNFNLTRSYGDASMIPQLVSAGVSSELEGLLHNDLEVAAINLFPELRLHKEKLQALGFPVVRMTGSGGAFYFWPVGKDSLREVERDFRGTKCTVRVVTTTDRGWAEE